MQRFKLNSRRQVTWSYKPRSGIEVAVSKQTEIAEEAFARWARVCGIDPVRISSGGMVRAYWTKVNGAKAQTSALGFPIMGRAYVKLDSSTPRWPEVMLMRALVHEFGHAIGIPHLNPKWKDSVMSPNWNMVTTPKYADITQAQKRYGKPLAKWANNDPTPDEPAEPPTEYDDDDIAALKRRWLLHANPDGFATNARGRKEKYFRGRTDKHNKNGWFFILPDGKVYRWMGGKINTSKLIATFGKMVYNDPSVLLG